MATLQLVRFPIFDYNFCFSLSILIWFLISKFVEWSKRERNATQYSVHDMQHTKMESLSVRLGSHYAFIHHGDCRHTFVISEIRFFQRF
jgi:hypothetical protein